MKKYEGKLMKIIENDDYMLAVLEAVESLKLNDAWVCAGFIRNKVWDTYHKITTPFNNIDVIYYDPLDLSVESEKQLEEKLVLIYPNQPWSVKNQARMHKISGFNPFSSSYDGVAHFPETPTAIAVRKRNQALEIMAPYGLDDLFEMKVKPTPLFQKNEKLYSIYLERLKKKKWDEIWKDLFIE